MNATHPHERTCPSRLRFDRLLAGELETAQAHELEQHAASCARCRPLLADVRRDHAAFGSATLPDAVMQRVRERSRSARSWTRVFAPLAAAAGLVLAWAAWPTTPRETAPGVRTKGGPQVTFYVLHEGAVRPGFDGERVHPGDRIEFAYSTASDGYFAIVSIDGARKASVYYAQDGHAAPVSAASRAVLDGSTELDDTLGPETVYALFCAQAIALDPVLQALERAPEQVPVVPGCMLERYSLLKVAR